MMYHSTVALVVRVGGWQPVYENVAASLADCISTTDWVS